MTRIIYRAAPWVLLASLWGCAAPTAPEPPEESEEKTPTELRMEDFQPGEVQVKEVESRIWMFARPDEEEALVVTYSIARPEAKQEAILIESNEKEYAFRLELPKHRFYPGLYHIKIYTDLDRDVPFKEVDYTHIDPDFYSRSPSDTIAPAEAVAAQQKAAGALAFCVNEPGLGCRLPLRGN